MEGTDGGLAAASLRGNSDVMGSPDQDIYDRGELGTAHELGAVEWFLQPKTTARRCLLVGRLWSSSGSRKNNRSARGTKQSAPLFRKRTSRRSRITSKPKREAQSTAMHAIVPSLSANNSTSYSPRPAWKFARADTITDNDADVMDRALCATLFRRELQSLRPHCPTL